MDRKGQGLYPGYDVLALQDERDAVTRQIVNKRLGPFQYKVCSHWEQTMIKTLAEHLTYDCRDEVLTWITAHVDQQLASPTGEAQRKPNTPPQRELIRGGLKMLDAWSKNQYGQAFLQLEQDQQFQIINSLQTGSLETIKGWDHSLQKDLFKKLVGLVIEAYYSHPWTWSEMGYGGPSYPRGYVRIGLGVTDPWEPKRGPSHA